MDLSDAHRVWPVPSRYRDTLPAEWALKGREAHPHEWVDVRDWLAGFRKYLTDSRFTAMRGHGLVLAGPVGVGKTMLAASIVNYLKCKGFSTAFVRDSDLYSLLVKRYRNEDEDDRLYLLQRAACVVVDDALRMGGTPGLLEPFLRTRQDEAKPTVITINNTVATSEALDSFLHEFTYVHIQGDDQRKID